ncbi:unnamed protein product [Agarophyton chilense]
MRSGYARFMREADYRHALGRCAHIPALCGAHWEHAASSSRAAAHHCVGYIVMRVCAGTSLDRLVRHCKIPDTVTHLRVLQRVVAALLFAQRVHPAITHQDLHPANVLLVPPPPPTSPPSPPASSPFPSPSPSPSPRHPPSSSTPPPPPPPPYHPDHPFASRPSSCNPSPASPAFDPSSASLTPQLPVAHPCAAPPHATPSYVAPPNHDPHSLYVPRPPPLDQSSFSLQMYHTYGAPYRPYVPQPNVSTPSLYPPASNQLADLYPPSSQPFSPSPSQLTPALYHQQFATQYYPQPPHTYYCDSQAHIPHSSSAPSYQQQPFPHSSVHPSGPSAPAPELPSSDYDPHKQSAPAHFQKRPQPNHASRPSSSNPAMALHNPQTLEHNSPSPPASHQNPEQMPPTSSNSNSPQPPPGYPHVSPEADSDSYHTASAPPFLLPSSSNQFAAAPFSATPPASDDASPQSPSCASSTQMPSAAFNIVPLRIQCSFETRELFMEELLEEARKRQRSVVENLGRLVFDEACKGLSRVLHPKDDTDMQLFGIQLRRMDYAACEQDYHHCGRDNIPIFAISYTHSEHQVGRYAFSDEQWENFEAAMRLLAKSNILKVRVWFDQCLWLRDSNLGCWAHTGMIPYVTWPVISLGLKVPEKDRTHDTYERVWPYLEEIAGLWSMGVITTSEMHQEDEDDVPVPVQHVRYNLRVCLDPQVSLYLLFHAICDGNLNELTCRYKEDIHELMDMAKYNMDYESDHVIVGSNWRARTTPLDRRRRGQRFRDVHCSVKGQFITAFSSGMVYLDC